MNTKARTGNVTLSDHELRHDDWNKALLTYGRSEVTMKVTASLPSPNCYRVQQHLGGRAGCGFVAQTAAWDVAAVYGQDAALQQAPSGCQ